MTRHETPIVVLLDLSPTKSITLPEMVACIPGRPHVEHVLKASAANAPQSDDGTPYTQVEWAACKQAIRRLAADVNTIADTLRARGESVRLWIGGSAGLPVFFQLGLELSSWSVPVTVVNREKGGAWERFPVERVAGGEPYFDATPPSQGAGSDAALVVSALGTITAAQVEAYGAGMGVALGSVTGLHAPAAVTETSFRAACHELKRTIDGLPSGSLTVFLRTPVQLAFATGYFINRKRFASITVPGFDHSAYQPALVLKSSASRPPRPRATQLSVVAFAADARTHGRLDLKREHDQIERALGMGKRKWEWLPVTHTDPDRFNETLRKCRPSIVHFSGHGGRAGICLESDEHVQVTMTPEQLAMAMQRYGPTVEVVVLNACFSATHVAALLEHVDCVISIERGIGDEAAIAFSQVFYRDVGDGKNVRHSYDLARNQMATNGLHGHELIRIDFAPGVDEHDVAP